MRSLILASGLDSALYNPDKSITDSRAGTGAAGGGDDTFQEIWLPCFYFMVVVITKALFLTVPFFNPDNVLSFLVESGQFKMHLQSVSHYFR